MRIEDLEGQESIFAHDSGSGKTSSGRSAAGEILQRVKNGLGQTFKKFSKRSSKLKNHTFMLLDLRQDAGNILGPCWEYDPVWLGSLGTLNTSECPKGAVESSLSQILQDTVPSQYWLSPKACRGMLRRADCRGKPLPELLELALLMQGGLIPPSPISNEVKAYHFNQRDEGIDLGDVSGALLATQNHQMQTFVTTPGAKPDSAQEPNAFAANQRDEVRDLHGVAGALQAQPMGSPARTQRSGSRGERNRSGISELSQQCESEGYEACGDAKQQTFVASFSAGAGSSAGSVGYNEAVSPTLKGSASGNCMPSVLCVNDQGGKIMECSEDVSGTLRAQEHGHQPLVIPPDHPFLYENHGIDGRYTGPHDVAPTMSARYGTGGNNIPLVQSEEAAFRPSKIFSRQRVDQFKDDDIASTESARQHKDATDIVCRPTSEWGDGSCHLLRRLTPLECERLQGYPDGWTDVPGASDSARYKALGNSVAIPCVEYLMKRVALVIALGLEWRL